MVTDSLKRFYPYPFASFYIYSITYLEYSLLLSESMLFANFFSGRSKMDMHPRSENFENLREGDFCKTGGGENSIYMHFYIILANEVKILVRVICSLIV